VDRLYQKKIMVVIRGGARRKKIRGQIKRNILKKIKF
jgi:hypothetical protein